MIKISCDICGKEMNSRRVRERYPIEIKEYDNKYETKFNTIDICEQCEYLLEKEIVKTKIRFLNKDI